jgi:ABC-type nitrate/sulfonate/bicarbonate transport system permease component
MSATLLRATSVLGFFALWEGVCRTGLVPPVMLPAPSTVLVAVFDAFHQWRFLDDVRHTLWRLFLGLFISIGLGVSLGVIAGQSRFGPLVLEPVVRVLSPLPKIAFFPAFLMIFGFGDAGRVLLVVSDAIFPVLLAAYHGARAVDSKLVWSARAAGMPAWRCTTRIVFPAALPGIVTGVRVSVVIGCIVVFFSEMVAPGDGLGDMLVRAARSFQSVQMFVPVVTISALGLCLDRLIASVRARYLAW